MKLWGPSAKVEQKDDGGTLVFYVERQWRLLDFLTAAILGGFIAGMSFNWKWGLLFAVLASAVLYLYSIASHNKSTFSASEKGLWYGGYELISWSRIIRLEYVDGDENTESGLYVKTGRWSRACLLSWLSREQGESIIHAIYSRFPYVEMAEEPQSILDRLVKEPEIIQLGLSKKNKE